MPGVRPKSTSFLLRSSCSFAGCLALVIFLVSHAARARASQSSLSAARPDTGQQDDNTQPCLSNQAAKKHKPRKKKTQQPCKCNDQANPGNPARPVGPPPPSPGAAPVQKENQKPSDRWGEAVKVLAEGGLALVSLTFAAFAFLYSSLLAIKEDHDGRAHELRDRLRHSLYATALTVLLSSALTVVAFWTMLSGGRVLTVLTVVLAILLVLAIPGIALYLVVDAAMEDARNAATE